LDKLFFLIKKYWYNINFKNAAKTNLKALGFPLLYKLIFEKIKEAKRYIIKNLAKNFIKPSAAA